MSISRNLKQRWNDDELTVALDLHLNQKLNDGHNHDAIAKCLGRYSPRTHSHNDGPVNQKLAEVISLLNPSRAKRHAGNRIVVLLKKYKYNKSALRNAAIHAWKNILQSHTGPIPTEVQRLLK